MLLHHGSNIMIEEIDLAKSRPNKDFGKAFYLSADEEQAREMAKFKVLTGGGDVCVSVFEFDEQDLDMLKIKRFENYTEEWAEFVYNNRDEKQDFQHDFDLVYGPIANDTIFDTLGIISSGFLTSEQAAKLLMIGPEYTQLAIKTEKAAAKLKWLGADKIERADVKTRKAEQEAYQEKLAEELEKILDGDKEN